MIEDIRDTDKDQYWETLRQRWGALMSYRYIGRQFSSMNKVDDDTVTLRHDMRNAAGGILSQIFSISAPGGGGPSDLEVVPNPVIHSVQILDNGNDVKRIEVVNSGALKVGTRMYFGRATIVDADDHNRVLALIEGQGASIGDVPPHIKGDQLFDDDPIEHVEDSPDLPPIWQVFGGSKRDDGHWSLGELQAEFASLTFGSARHACQHVEPLGQVPNRLGRRGAGDRPLPGPLPIIDRPFGEPRLSAVPREQLGLCIHRLWEALF